MLGKTDPGVWLHVVTVPLMANCTGEAEAHETPVPKEQASSIAQRARFRRQAISTVPRTSVGRVAVTMNKDSVANIAVRIMSGSLVGDSYSRVINEVRQPGIQPMQLASGWCKQSRRG